MAAASNIRLYRSLLKELKTIYKQGKLEESAAFLYIKDQFRRHEVTSEKHCRGDKELQHMADTYLCHLRSAREYQALATLYKGAGELDVSSAAHLVGLEVPKPYQT